SPSSATLSSGNFNSVAACPSAASTRTTAESREARPARRQVIAAGSQSQSIALPISTGKAGADARFESAGEKVQTTARGRPGALLTSTSGVPLADFATASSGD